MRNILLTTALLAAIGASPAYARLQLSISDGTSTFSCFDGEGSCDLNGGANNLLTVDTTLDGNFVQITLAQSTFGPHNVLQLSSDNITSTSGATITFVASDTNFLAPVSSIKESASLTFNANVGASASFLKFWADGANAQGANPLNTPGTLLDTVSGVPLTDPDSFSGTKFSAFLSGSPFSMTEGASLNLIAGGSVTGFNESMTSSVPEPKTWAMILAGFGLMGALGFKRAKTARFAI
jgi:hypothetical protein